MKQTKAPNIFRGFKAWLKKQPKDKRFNFQNTFNCLLSTFLQVKNPKAYCLIGEAHVDGSKYRIPKTINKAISVNPLTPRNALKALGR